MLDELMTVNDTVLFVSILNLQIIKGMIVVGFERKKGEDFTWLWRRWLREMVLWRGKASQSRYIPLASISWKEKILGLSSGNPCWLWDMPLLGCWVGFLPSVVQFGGYGSQGKILEATVEGQWHWTHVLAGDNLTPHLGWHCSGQSRFPAQGDSVIMIFPGLLRVFLGCCTFSSPPREHTHPRELTGAPLEHSLGQRLSS